MDTDCECNLSGGCTLKTCRKEAQEAQTRKNTFAFTVRSAPSGVSFRFFSFPRKARQLDRQVAMLLMNSSLFVIAKEPWRLRQSKKNFRWIATSLCSSRGLNGSFAFL